MLVDEENILRIYIKLLIRQVALWAMTNLFISSFSLRYTNLVIICMTSRDNIMISHFFRTWSRLSRTSHFLYNSYDFNFVFQISKNYSICKNLKLDGCHLQRQRVLSITQQKDIKNWPITIALVLPLFTFIGRCYSTVFLCVSLFGRKTENFFFSNVFFFWIIVQYILFIWTSSPAQNLIWLSVTAILLISCHKEPIQPQTFI